MGASPETEKILRDAREEEMDKKQKQKKRLDQIGLICGCLLLILAVVCILYANRPAVAGVRDSEIPESALTLEGSAEGRNGPVRVQVVADNEQIYRVRVLEHQETEGIGSEAIYRMPEKIIATQSLRFDDVEIDGVTGATVSSKAVNNAVINALDSGELQLRNFDAYLVKTEVISEKPDVDALKGDDGHIRVITSADWAETYPNEYATWAQNAENDGQTDYLVDYPYLKELYEPYGFSRDYLSARGHTFDLDDIRETARVGEKTKSSCFTCKTPMMTAMALEEGDLAYGKPFAEVNDMMAEPISCFNCHANSPMENGEVHLVTTHTYLIDGVGDDFENIDAANLSCGQCHNEYFFDPTREGAPVTLPHSSLRTMHPDQILAFYNDPNNFADGLPFADYTNTESGVRQIKVQHPEIETYLSVGSPHRDTYTCADCHMGTVTTEGGETYSSHYLISPLENQELLEGTCSQCHANLPREVKRIQNEIEARTDEVAEELVTLKHRIGEAMASGDYSEEELDAIRALARDAQFYWDFVFVENSNGAHNPQLARYCLDKAEELCQQAMGMFK
jgi:nitrite reductase (cytochrome c-552)